MNEYYCVLSAAAAGLIGFAIGYCVEKQELEYVIRKLKKHVSLYEF